MTTGQSHILSRNPLKRGEVLSKFDRYFNQITFICVYKKWTLMIDCQLIVVRPILAGQTPIKDT